MEQPVHPLAELFKQLGLPAEIAAIDRFIAAHAPLAADVVLADAWFWSPAQAMFLREEILEDADWAEIIDHLNLALRADTAAQ
ncbi:MAG: DUF2789 domain-containing protein [Glaciimonas sp.]|nr:DUF2789 domain-containing protein [Glaciimonas sp.]